MAPKIKLQRVGTKNQPKYRVVIQETREKLDGKVIDILGIYHPRSEPSLFEVSKERVEEWLKQGAQPTEKVRILLGKAGLMPPVDLSTKTKRKPKKEEKPVEAAAAPAEAPAAEAAPVAEKPAEGPKEEAKA